MKRLGHTWTDAQRANFRATWNAKRKKNGKPALAGNPVPVKPELVYILLNGKLQRFVLRTMPVYIPAEELK